MPYGCQTQVSVPSGTTSIIDFAYSTGFPQNECACPQMVSLTIPDSVESIGQAAFDGCSNLTTGDHNNNLPSSPCPNHRLICQSQIRSAYGPWRLFHC